MERDLNERTVLGAYVAEALHRIDRLPRFDRLLWDFLGPRPGQEEPPEQTREELAAIVAALKKQVRNG